jgi:hypothetical protein
MDGRLTGQTSGRLSPQRLLRQTEQEHSMLVIHDVRLSTTLRDERVAVVSEEGGLEENLRDVLRNSEPSEELVSFEVINSRAPAPEEAEDCAWLVLDADGKHPWLTGGRV